MRGAGDHHKRALIDAIRKVTGRSTTFDGVSTAGMLDRDLIESMLLAAGETPQRIDNTRREIGEQSGRFYEQYCQEDLRAFVCRNVRETLDKLSGRQAVMALVSGNLASIGWRKVNQAQIRAYFALGAFSEDGRTRASLASIARLRAIEQGLVSEDASVSLVGDHANDIAAAKANQFQSIAVATGILTLDELKAHKPDIAVQHLGELDLNLLFPA